MTSLTFKIKLPLEGLIIRDFALTTLAHLKNIGFELYGSTDALIKTYSPNDLAKDYSEILKKTSENAIPKIYRTDNSAKRKLFSEIKTLSGKVPKETSEAIKNYVKWLEEKPEKNVEILLRSLETLEWDTLGDNVIRWGQKPSIPALQLFKLNYYAGKRTFLPYRYQEARIYLDIHTFIFSLAGAILAKVGTLRSGPTVYLSTLRSGALDLFYVLRELFGDLGYRTTPEVVFRILNTMRVPIPGNHPLRMLVINEVGDRPSLLTCQNITVDRELTQFIKTLTEELREELYNLLKFTLRNWETNDRKQRIIVRVGYELAQAIYMSTTGAIKPADIIFRLARVTYATISGDFAKALDETKHSPIRSIKKFQKLLVGVEEALEKCFLAH